MVYSIKFFILIHFNIIFFFVAKPSHRVADLCLDNMLEPTFVRNLFQNIYVETLSSATRTMLQFKYLEFHSNWQMFNVGRASHCQLIIFRVHTIAERMLCIPAHKPSTIYTVYIL